MPMSVQPLVINYSFAGNATQATDQINLAQLDASFAAINAKITEIIDAVNTIQRDDNALADQAVDFRNLSDDVLQNITSQINAAVAAST